MLAFSGCYYGGGDEERRELGKIRKRWKTLRVCHKTIIVTGNIEYVAPTTHIKHDVVSLA